MARSGYQPRPGAQGAWELFQHLIAGGVPTPVQSTLRLDSGEVLMDETAHVSIWVPTDVQYKAYNRWTYIQGAPIWSLAATVVNRHRTSRNRRKAAQEAAAQWRGPDLLRVVVTSQSVWWRETETGEWLDVPFGMIAEMRVDPYAGVTEFELKSKPPLRFAGPWAAFAGILIAHFVYAGQLAAVPGLAPFAAA